MKQELRRAKPADDLDVSPQDFRRVSRPEGLHRRFFGGEPTREVDGWIAPARTIEDLSIGENSLEKPVAVTLDHGSDAVDFRQVDAKTDNVRQCFPSLPRAFVGCKRPRVRLSCADLSRRLRPISSRHGIGGLAHRAPKTLTPNPDGVK
jgi:hypothetical protein